MYSSDADRDVRTTRYPSNCYSVTRRKQSASKVMGLNDGCDSLSDTESLKARRQICFTESLITGELNWEP